MWKVGRIGVVLATLSAFGLSVAAARLAITYPDSAPGGGSAWAPPMQVLAATTLTAAGAVMAFYGRLTVPGVLLVLAGYSVVAGQIPAAEATTPVAFTAALAASTIAVPLVLAAALSFPISPRLRTSGTLAALVSTVTIFGVALVPAAVFDPKASGCFTCPTNLLAIQAHPGAYPHLLRAGESFELVTGAIVGAYLVGRWLTAPRAVRRDTGGPFIAAVLLAGVMSLSAGHSLARTAGPNLWTHAYWLTECTLMIGLAGGIAASAVTTRRTAAALSRDVVAGTVDGQRLADLLSEAISVEPVEIVVYRDGAPPVAVDGEPAPNMPSSQQSVALTRQGLAIAEVRFPRSHLGLTHRIVASIKVAGLALEHSAASSRLRAELRELEASRLRIVESGDEERRSLEHDLHDGAQQRLIASGMFVQAATRTAGPGYEIELAEIGAEIRLALEELRTVARGIYPAVLTVGGLRAGLSALTETSPVPLAIDVVPDVKAHRAVEATVYRLTATAAKRMASCGVRSAIEIGVRSDHSILTTTIRIPTDAAEAASDIAAQEIDRITSLGGTIEIEGSAGESVIRARIPCGL